MGARRPSTYADNTAYAEDTKVIYNGVIYQAAVAVPATNTTNPLDGEGTTFRAIGVIEGGFDAISLWHDIFFTANEESLEDHIWTFIEASCIEINQILRGPSIRVTRSVFVDDQSRADVSRLNFIDIENVRLTGDSALDSSSILQRGKIEMLASNKAEFQEVRLSYGNNFEFQTNGGFTNPLYYLEDGYLYFAPDLEEGVEIEITYFEYQPILGSEAVRSNDEFEPLNADGETIEEWIAEGNDAGDFVVDIITVETNIWFQQFPKLFKFAALKHAEAFLGSTAKVESWKTMYLENLELTQDYLERFDSNQPHQITMNSMYAQL